MKGVCECEIIAHTEVGPGVVRTLLKGPKIARESSPGQFVNVQVAKTTDPLLRRPFSVHAAYPDEGVYSLLYVLRGRGTALLYKIPPGEKVSVVGPLGRGFELGDSPDARHIVVAGGCGAAPMHFLCDALCAKWGCAKVTVLSGAQSKDAVLCEAEFKAHGVDVGISTDDGSYGYRGFVTELLKEHLLEASGSPSPQPSPARGEGASRPSPQPTVAGGEGVSGSQLSTLNSQLRVYSCGPHAMLREVARVCREAGVGSCQVSLENNMACGFGVCTGCVQKIKGAAPEDTSGRDWHFERVCTDGPAFNAEDILWE